MLAIFDSLGVPNQGPRLAKVSLVLCCIAILFVATRVAGRLARTSNSVGLDDACIVVALVSLARMINDFSLESSLTGSL